MAVPRTSWLSQYENVKPFWTLLQEMMEVAAVTAATLKDVSRTAWRRSRVVHDRQRPALWSCPQHWFPHCMAPSKRSTELAWTSGDGNAPAWDFYLYDDHDWCWKRKGDESRGERRREREWERRGGTVHPLLFLQLNHRWWWWLTTKTAIYENDIKKIIDWWLTIDNW